MAEIIQIGDGPKTRKPDEVSTGLEKWVWTCNACGNSTFQIIQGGSLRCANCNLACLSIAHFNPNDK